MPTVAAALLGFALGAWVTRAVARWRDEGRAEVKLERARRLHGIYVR